MTKHICNIFEIISMRISYDFYTFKKKCRECTKVVYEQISVTNSKVIKEYKERMK